ncbi:MAG: hypothetical protein ACJ8AI_14735, partial [Rhodopila sp.]
TAVDIGPAAIEAADLAVSCIRVAGAAAEQYFVTQSTLWTASGAVAFASRPARVPAAEAPSVT